MGKLIIEYNGYDSNFAFPDCTVEASLLRMIAKDKSEDADDHIIDTSTLNMIYVARCLRKENRLNGMELVIRIDEQDYPINKDGKFSVAVPEDVLDDWLERLL